MRSSHRIGPVANWKFYPSPGSKIEICSLKAEHEPIPDICRLFYITAIRGQDILQLKVGKFETKVVSRQDCVKFFTLYATFCTVFCLPIGKYYTWLISFYTTIACDGCDKYQVCIIRIILSFGYLL